MSEQISQETEESLSSGVRNLYDRIKAVELENGIVRIDGEIGSCDADIYLDVAIQHEPKELTIILNSPGGNAYDALALYDIIKSAPMPSRAIVQGHAASAASMIVLQACSIRQSRPHARFLIHEARQWIFMGMQRTSDLKDDLKEMEAITERIVSIMAERSHKTPAEVKASFERKELWMSAEEALKWGLIDEIIS